ncbi:hypothetical protein [Streptosporangium sp. NBC_01469]|nr:hypothetical protein [Streptosporangium sp. NBC_01469]
MDTATLPWDAGRLLTDTITLPWDRGRLQTDTITLPLRRAHPRPTRQEGF